MFERHFRGKSFSFSGNVKIINASLKFLMKVPMQKSKIQSLQSRVYIANLNLKSFSNQRFDSALKLSYAKSSPLFLSSFICKKHLFLFNILFQSHLIRHSSSQNIFKDTQRALGHSQGTWALKSLGHTTTQRVLGHSEDTWAPEHLRHLGTQAPEQLKI